MFQNPNDLALNLVAVLPLAALLAVIARHVRPVTRSRGRLHDDRRGDRVAFAERVRSVSPQWRSS
jgi:hypothetical protein